MAEKTKSNNEKEETREKFKILVNEPSPFVATTATKLMSSSSVCELINCLFKPVFSDFIGSSIQVNSNGAAAQVMANIPVYPNPEGIVPDVPLNAFYATLYFADRGSNAAGVKTLRNITEASKETGKLSIGQRYMQMNKSALLTKTYEISDETKEAIEEFMYVNPYTGIGKGFWDQHIIEYGESVGTPWNPKVTANVKITGLNINAIIAKIFGEQNEEGEKYNYLITPNIPASDMPINKNVIFQISRMEMAEFNQFVNSIFNGSVASSYTPAR